MQRYVWSFNDKTLAQDAQILIKKGENVRFILKNETMMNHPLHLHGHFFRVVNSQGDFSPLKHTVDVAPLSTTIIELDANLEEDWFFHCHNLYHMKSGMSRVISYEGSSKFSNEALRSILSTRRWYRQASNEAASNFIAGSFSLGDTLNEFSIDYDKNFDDDFKLEARYNRHYSQFFSAFIGVEGDGETKTSHQHEHENLIVAGIQYTLPLLVESEVRLDNKGNLRLQLESDLQLSKRFNLSWHWNTDDEYRYGISVDINKKWAITLSEDSDYGGGIGVRITF